MFGGFTEGLQLFASFAMLMNFPRFNKMKGMGQIVSWSVRDESLHCEGITRLFHAFVKERGCLTKSVKEDILDVCQKTVRLEDAFIDLAFEMGPVPGMTPKEIKKYIRYIADWRLGQLGFSPIYMIDDHPLPWLAPLLNGVEHANFFETRATEYSKAATRGNWGEVWDNFDRRKAANAANDGLAPQWMAGTICSLGLVWPRSNRLILSLSDEASSFNFGAYRRVWTERCDGGTGAPGSERSN
jgi:ribonucleoside-diphosphate reductase beta chain